MDLSFFDGPCRRARGGLEITNRAELQHMEARSVSESLMRLLCKSVTAACPGVQNEHKRRRVGTPHPPSMCYFAGTADTGGACTGIAPTTTAVQMSPRSPSRRSSGSFEHPPYPFMLSPSASLRELDEPLTEPDPSTEQCRCISEQAGKPKVSTFLNQFERRRTTGRRGAFRNETDATEHGIHTLGKN